MQQVPQLWCYVCFARCRAESTCKLCKANAVVCKFRQMLRVRSLARPRQCHSPTRTPLVPSYFESKWCFFSRSSGECLTR